MQFKITSANKTCFPPDKLIIFLIVTLVLSTKKCNSFILPRTFVPTLTNLYLRNIEETRIFCRFRRVSFNIELGDYHKLKAEIITLADTLRETCEKFNFKISCHHLADDIAMTGNTFDDGTKIIQSLRGYFGRQKRHKRYTESISVFQKLPKTIGRTQVTHENLLHVTKTLKSINFIGPTYVQEFTQIYRDLYLMLSNLRNYIHLNDLVIQTMLQTNSQAILDLISVGVLTKILNQINAMSTPEYCRLPEFRNAMDIIKILETSIIESEITGNNFLLNIKFATIHEQKYNLFQIIALPLDYENTSFILKPTSQYYLIGDDYSDNKTYVFALSLEEKLRCKWTNHLICFPSQPMQIMGGTQSDKNKILQKIEICANKTTTELLKPESHCTISAVPFQNKIILLTENTYYIHIVQKTNATVRCGNVTHNISVPTTGLMTNELIEITIKCS